MTNMARIIYNHDEYEVEMVDFSAVITTHTPDNIPIIKIIGFQLEKIKETTNTMFSSLTEVAAGRPPPYLIDKNTLLANAWNLNVGTEGGIHETIIFRADGAIYKGDNKTLRTPETVYSYDNGTIEIFDKHKTITEGFVYFRQNIYSKRNLG